MAGLATVKIQTPPAQSEYQGISNAKRAKRIYNPEISRILLGTRRPKGSPAGLFWLARAFPWTPMRQGCGSCLPSPQQRIAPAAQVMAGIIVFPPKQVQRKCPVRGAITTAGSPSQPLSHPSHPFSFVCTFRHQHLLKSCGAISYHTPHQGAIAPVAPGHLPKLQQQQHQHSQFPGWAINHNQPTRHYQHWVPPNASPLCLIQLSHQVGAL